MRAQKERNVVMLGSVADLEHHNHFGIEAANALPLVIRSRVESQPICPHQDFRLSRGKSRAAIPISGCLIQQDPIAILRAAL